MLKLIVSLLDPFAFASMIASRRVQAPSPQVPLGESDAVLTMKVAAEASGAVRSALTSVDGGASVCAAEESGSARISASDSRTRTVRNFMDATSRA